MRWAFLLLAKAVLCERPSLPHDYQCQELFGRSDAGSYHLGYVTCRSVHFFVVASASSGSLVFSTVTRSR